MPIQFTDLAPLRIIQMSTISSLSGGLAQFVQNLNPSGAASATSNASSGATTGATAHHHHGGGFAKLADAIESALQSASNASSGSSTSTDPNQTITQALTKIFQNGSLNSTSEADGDTASAQAPETGTNGTNASPPAGTLPEDFVQTLKSFGVTPQQFQTDLASALQT